MKDLNFQGHSITVRQDSCDGLKVITEQDALFLEKHSVMDYSLIGGIHEVKLGCVLGDLIRK